MGENVKYNGGNNLIDIKKLQDRYDLIPFCPEVAGGLPIPRAPSEIVSHDPIRIADINGKDVTNEFLKGAELCLDLVKKEGIKKALLKSNSPSCSSSKVYDGTFEGKLTEGNGVTASILKDIGIEVFDETTCTFTE